MRDIESPIPNAELGLNRLGNIRNKENPEHPKLKGIFRETDDEVLRQNKIERLLTTEYITNILIPEILSTYELTDQSIPGTNILYLYKEFKIDKSTGKKMVFYQNQMEIIDKNGKSTIITQNKNKPPEKMNPISFFVSTELLLPNKSEEDILNNKPPYSINHEKFEALKIPKKEHFSNQISTSEQVR